MYIWIHDKYSSTSFKQRLWQRKIVLIWQNYFFLNHVCHCGAVVKELLARADKPGSTPGDAVFCLFVPFLFFFLFSLGFSFSPVFLYSYCGTCWSCTWINIYFKLKSRVLFWERNFIFSWSASPCFAKLRARKNHKLSTYVPSPLKELNFFQC